MLRAVITEKHLLFPVHLETYHISGKKESGRRGLYPLGSFLTTSMTDVLVYKKPNMKSMFPARLN
jgi:hypothetical protein